MFVLQDMVIDALVCVVILVTAFTFVYILTTITGEWRTRRRAWITERRQRATRNAARSVVPR